MKKNKKILAGLIMGLALLLAGCDCSVEIIDEPYYTYALIELPTGQIVEGEIEEHFVFGKSGTVDVTINGITYRTHSENVCLMKGIK